MALIGLAVLVKPWVQANQLKYQHALIQAQALNLQRQEESYQQFYAMLQSRDPVLLQRLAYHYLSLKPVGVAVLNGFTDRPSVAAPVGGLESSGPVSDIGSELALSDTVESWLHKPLPKGLALVPESQSRLFRLTTGWQRFVVMAVGLLCLAAAFLSGGRLADELD